MILKRATSLSLALVMTLVFVHPVFAADDTASSNASAIDSTSEGSSGATGSGSGTATATLEDKRVYEGHLQTEVTNLETSLKEVSTTMKHLKRAGWDMFVEVQRQNMVVVGEPDVIGPIVIPAIPNPTGMIATGSFQPPRKKWLDYINSQIAYLTKLIQTDIAALTLPPDASDTARTEWQAIKDMLPKVAQDATDLANLTQGPKYENMAIARAAQILENDVQTMEKSCKKVYEEIRKEASQLKKDMRTLNDEIKRESKGQ